MVYRLNVWGSSAFISTKQKKKERVRIASLEFNSSEFKLHATGGTAHSPSLPKLHSYKETAIGIGVSSAAKPRSAKRLSKRFVCCCFERRLK